MPRTKEDYEWYKRHGICVQCGSNMADYGKTRCLECLAKNAESAKKRRENKTHIKYSRKDYMRDLRQTRKNNGQCIWCGGKLSQYSTCFCIDCKIKNQRKNDERKNGIDRSERYIYGLCYRCGKKTDNGKLCNECKNQSIENLSHVNKEKWIKYNKKQNRLVFSN